jgi:phospho-N-acetylmuramoyl-pentapeptide-transferase
MLYHLFDAIDFSVPGSGVFNFISFRAAMAVFVSLLISLWWGQGHHQPLAPYAGG